MLSPPTWKPSEQLAGRRAPSREEEVAQPRLAQALLGLSRVRLQDGRAPALLRGPIWQSCWCEAALPWASLAQTCLAARLPAQEGAGCEAGRRHWRLPGLSSAPALPLHLGPRRPLAGLRGRWLAHCEGLKQEELCAREGRASAGLRKTLLGRTDSALHGVHQAPRALAGVCSPAHPEADSWGAQQLPHTRSFLALSSPAETCAAGWGLPLRAWAPAHSPSSGQAAPEPRPAGGRAPPPGSRVNSWREASLLEGRRGSPASFGSSPTWLEPSAPPGRQSSSSAQRPDLAELLARGCSALGEPCPDLPRC
ncbi:uncharacterized protein LOC132659108 [Ovis aries]|uniref:uncharacterized protein LOC132659108 n=1 Tax=Ovis aries TaxID=9940 RepID=UPI00295285EF|nr:uncharacterized protein LOC132659108 [Ovis aries]